MTEGKYRLEHLADTSDQGRPSDNAYSAMAMLLVGRFLRLTERERAKQIHLGPACRPACGLCEDVALRHAQWATDKLAGHRRTGPPKTGGVVVRDWVTILTWVSSPDTRDIEVRVMREALERWLSPDDPSLPFVLAIGTQLLPASGRARGPRSMRDYVGDWRKSVVAQGQGWAVKPDRDLTSARMFAATRQRHPRGVQLLVDVVKRLEWGDDEPYHSVLGRSETQVGDQAELRAVIGDLLAAEPTRSWFLRNIDARHSYNQDLRRRTNRFDMDVDLLADDGESPADSWDHDLHPHENGVDAGGTVW